MSYADDMGYDAYDGEFFEELELEQKQEFENKLETGIHTNAEGEKIDVRNISKRYANNLYDWYLRTYGDEIIDSNLMKILKNKRGEK